MAPLTLGLDQGREAPTDVDIHPLLSHRWSPRAFSSRPVEPEKLIRVLEAGRWAPSSYNEQPWRFLVASGENARWLQRLQNYLVPANAWAKKAPVLIVSAYRATFTRTGKPNRMAMRDLGAAEQNMVLEAFHQGLVAHQMQGFDHERVTVELLPDGFGPGAMMALGYLGDPNELPEDIWRKEHAERSRRPLVEMVFGPLWGEPPGFL